MGLRSVKLDLHIHTVVSPCAEVEMIPPLIVRRALELGLDLIAITDHNTAENVQAVQRAAADSGLIVLPGMEVQTREEVHILCLFDTMAQLDQWQDRIYQSLPPARNRPEVFGAQFVVDETGEFVCENERLLLTSVNLSTEAVVADVRRLGGLSIAAHVDRPSYSLLGNLGFVPESLGLSALEIRSQSARETLYRAYPDLERWPLICSSDAHRLGDMCVKTTAKLRRLTATDLGLALEGVDGRSVELVA